MRQAVQRPLLRNRKACQSLRCRRLGDYREAYQRAFSTDPESAFGGIIAFNRPLDAVTARAIIEQQFVEVIIAPGILDGAAEVVASKENLRLLCCDPWDEAGARYDYKHVNGGVLVQQADQTALPGSGSGH